MKTMMKTLLGTSALFAALSAQAGPVSPTAAPVFAGIDSWLNSAPLTMPQLRGKVVLVDFWTYTCINCIRTLPYVKSWHEKYKNQGLVVVGVHTPEYPHERSTANVAAALKRFDIQYPVAQDNRYATWDAYHNQYWPATYLIDKSGRIVYTHFGEGQYDETEAAIRRLLAQPG
jgi:thiol-disulfide isomerase/thioredoxin